MVHDAIYFHINNGGVTFDVEDNGNGPEIVVSATHFGHETARTKVAVTQRGLVELAAFFSRQAVRKFSDEYCVAAKTLEEVGFEIGTSVGQAVNAA
jgi:hypothetical protein